MVAWLRLVGANPCGCPALMIWQATIIADSRTKQKDEGVNRCLQKYIENNK